MSRKDYTTLLSLPISDLKLKHRAMLDMYAGEDAVACVAEALKALIGRLK